MGQEVFCYGTRQYSDLHIRGGAGRPAGRRSHNRADENGAVLTRLTTDTDGYAEAADLPAPDKSYSLDEANTTVRPYAVYGIEAALTGWQTAILNDVQVFDGQPTVARVELLPAEVVPAAARMASGNSGCRNHHNTTPPHSFPVQAAAAPRRRCCGPAVC